MIELSFVVLLLLVVAGSIDFFTKKVPAIFLTALIFAVAFLNYSAIAFGILGFVFAYLIYEAGFIGGVADIKAIVVVSMMLSSSSAFFPMIIFIMILGIFYKAAMVYFIKKSQTEEVPFVLVIVLVYIVLMLGGWII